MIRPGVLVILGPVPPFPAVPRSESFEFAGTPAEPVVNAQDETPAPPQ